MALLPVKALPEKLLVPPYLYFFLMIYPPSWVADPRVPTAAAAGGSILMRREAPQRIGGIGAGPGGGIEDFPFPGPVEKRGGKNLVGPDPNRRNPRRLHPLRGNCRFVAARA